MGELVLYPNDTPTQAVIERIAAAKMGPFINEYTVGTGDGGQQVKDEASLPLLANALKGLIEECEIAARAEFKDSDPAAIRRDAEEVVMRKALISLSERAEVIRLQEILGLSADTKARLEKFLQ